MEKKNNKEYNKVSKVGEMCNVIDKVTNKFKKELIHLTNYWETPSGHEEHLYEAFQCLFFLFEYLEKNVELPKNYSFLFHFKVSDLAERLRIVREFRKLSNNILEEIGEDNE